MPGTGISKAELLLSGEVMQVDTGCTAWDNLGQVTCSSLGLRNTWMLISHKRLLGWLKICKDLFSIVTRLESPVAEPRATTILNNH